MATLRIADSVGRVLGGRYRLTRPLGTGASAHVYVADDVTLRRRVAIKVLHLGLADDEGFLRRFRAEARFVAALRHPNILRVYDWGEDDGSAYLVTELLEGGSLRALLDSGHLLSSSQATAIGLEAADALEHAHRRGLVHRDIKPANLLFDDEGRVCIADFGLARALAESTVTEPVGAIVGTARYAAPEQVQGRTLDARADVYSLALVLVEATTGVVPFAADTILATLMGRLATPLRVPDDAGPLADLIEAAGTVDPADRLDAAGMVKALRALARTLPPPAPLPLAGPLSTGQVERDVNPTQLRGAPAGPGRSTRPPEAASVLLDLTALDAEPPPVSPSALPTAALPPGALAPPLPPAPPPLVVDGGPVAERAATRPSAAPPVGASAAETGYEERDPTGAGATLTRYADDDTEWEEAKPAGAGSAGGAAGAPEADRPGPYDDLQDTAPAGPRRRRWWPAVLAVVLVLLVAAGGLTAWARSHQPVPLVAVPSLRGETEAQATATLARRHLLLRVGARGYDAGAAAGTVTGQAPAGGRLREHLTVSVTMSLGPRPIQVPARLEHLSQARATRRIKAAGLQLGRVTTTSSLTVARGDVVAYSPSSGTLLPGQAVALVVSTGKPDVTVPELVGTAAGSYVAAAAALSADHLVPSEELEYSNTVSKGAVIVTNPAPKASVVWGSPVQVEVSEGPHLVAVPSVDGDTVGGADQVLTDDGFNVTGVAGNPSGLVAGTNPAYGETVLFGSSIQIVTG